MQEARFDTKPSQVGEKDKKEEKSGKIVFGVGLNPWPEDYKSCT